MDKDLLSMADLTGPEVWDLMHSAVELKQQRNSRVLEGRALALVFELPSLRTRASFDVGMRQLGGQCIYLSPQEIGLGTREPASDVARVLSRYVDGIVARTRRHQTVVDLANFASVPVINGLSDGEHPCQVLADLLTIYEHKGKLEGLNITYVGDGNNMAASLSLGAMLVGANLTMAAPEGYLLPPEIVSAINDLGAKSEEFSTLTPTPRRQCPAPMLSTPTSGQVWVRRQNQSGDYGTLPVTKSMLSFCLMSAITQYLCTRSLPTRGEEVSDEVMEHPLHRSLRSGRNRLHAQKAVLARLLSQS